MLIFDYKDVEDLLEVTDGRREKVGAKESIKNETWFSTGYDRFYVVGAKKYITQEKEVETPETTLQKVGRKIKQLAGKQVKKQTENRTTYKCITDDNILPHAYLGGMSKEGAQELLISCEETEFTLNDDKTKTQKIMLPVLRDKKLDFDDILRLAKVNPMLLAKVESKEKLTEKQLFLLKDATITMPYHLMETQEKICTELNNTNRKCDIRIIAAEQDKSDMSLYKALTVSALKQFVENANSNANAMENFENNINKISLDNERSI